MPRFRGSWRAAPAILAAGLLATALPAQTLEPEPAWVEPGTFYGQFASALAAAGDVNDDGFDDLLMGGPFYFTPCCPSINQQGAVLVYLGSATGLSTAIAWWEIGANQGTTLGYRVAGAGDVNDDGHDDVLFSSGSGFGDGTHAIHVRYGSPTGPAAVWNYDTGLMFGALGPDVDGGGDVDGDGIADIVAGFPRLDGSRGRVLLFRGSPSGLPLFPDQELVGREGQRLGEQVAFAGDVDDDGHDDLLVCDREVSGAEHLHLYRGSPTGFLSPPAWTDDDPGLSCLSTRSFLGVGDLDGDGHDDVAVGSPFRQHAGGTGLVRIFLGSDSGLADEPDQVLFGDGQFGLAVGAAGDINMDGRADLAVGADGGQPIDDPGSVFVFFGMPGGVHAAPSWTAGPVVGNRDLGWSVTGAGDLNGDGFGDLVAGDPNSPDYFYGRAFAWLNAGILQPGPAAAVPAGNVAAETATQPLLLARDDTGDVELSWGHSCLAAEEDFVVYAGLVGDYPSHLPASPCGIGGGTSWTEPAAGPSRYYLVVPRSLDAEGSYGLGEGGRERQASAEACFPQDLLFCD